MHLTTITFFLLSLFALHAFAFPSFSSLVTRKGHGADKAANGTSAMNGTHAKMHDQAGKNSTESLCAEMKMLMHLSKIAGNETASTAFASKAKNATKATDELATAATKLSTMMSNSTLVSECATVDAAAKTKAMCKKIEKLTKLVDIAKNSTKMAEVMKKAKNETREMEMINGAAAKLATLTTNSTLTSLCTADAATKDSKGNSTTESAAAATTSSSTSGVAASAVGGPALMLVSLLGAAMSML